VQAIWPPTYPVPMNPMPSMSARDVNLGRVVVTGQEHRRRSDQGRIAIFMSASLPAQRLILRNYIP
jgi:hypothetical protein